MAKAHSLTEDQQRVWSDALDEAFEAFHQTFPRAGYLAEERRQPIHTFYVGAHHFTHDAVRKLGSAARRHFDEYFPDLVTLAEVFELAGSDGLPDRSDPRLPLLARLEQDALAVSAEHFGIFLAASLHRRILRKLAEEPIEDLRIDFEDGYGHRPEDEEDRDAVAAAEALAASCEEGTATPSVGIRIKSFGPQRRRRSWRTLGLFVTALARKLGGAGVPPLTVTLPKIVTLQEVAVLAELLESLEKSLGIPENHLSIELLVETPQFLTHCGGRAIPNLLRAARGRCRSALLGIYDLTAACEVVATQQTLGHPLADFARSWLKLSLAGSGLHLGDSGSHALPVGPYRQIGGPPLTAFELERNRQTVHKLSKKNYDDIRHSLQMGIYQGMDLHPSQLPVRFAAVYAFFLEQVKEMTLRLRTFIDARLGGPHPGDFLDDDAHGQALLNFFARGVACGALHPEEAAATGLSVEELAGRSFQAILEQRWQQALP